ncbi:hypothetical protein F4804DRAFT_173116 [Jackrogersella minutella]|nr:hypothetical protein F4804DRAFT_173116 [Jackrogersella minutella]
MGAYISISQCPERYNITLNCTFEGKNVTVDGQQKVEAPFTSIGGYTRGQFPGDPDIAGIGILGVFVAVTSFAIAASITSIIWQFAKTYHFKVTYTEEQKAERQTRTSFSDILEMLILACSDQQMFTGAAYALTLRYWRGCTISAYHYNIVANMMLLTCATHLISVTIVRNYWKFPWLAFLRVVSITFVFIVTGLLMTNQNADTDLPFPTGVPNANETDSPIFLAAACFQTDGHTVSNTFKELTSNAQTFFKDNIADSTPNNKIQGWNLYILTLLFYGAATIAELIRFFRRGTSRPGLRAKVAHQFRRCCGLGTPLRKIVESVFLFYLAAGVGLSCAVTIISTSYIFRLRQWVDKSGWMQLANNQNPENDAKSFGQLVPIFSSALIVFSFAQIISEKLTRQKNRKDEDEELSQQAGTIQYFDPSRCDLTPPRILDKDGERYLKTPGVRTASLPPRVDLENQLAWGSEMNLGGAQLATPLLSSSNYSSTTTVSGMQPARDSSSHDASPLRYEEITASPLRYEEITTSPPSFPFSVRPQGHSQGNSQGASSVSSRSSSTPQTRSLMGSPNVSHESTPRPGDVTRLFSRPV